jgi:hypothetical protein
METQTATDIILFLCKLLFGLFSAFVLFIAWYFREFKQSTKEKISELRTDMENRFNENREDHSDLYNKLNEKQDRRKK